MISSIFGSRPILADHQRVALRTACEILDRHGGVLLADAVGLGKSWIAAALVRELAIPAEIIVPASLVVQWNETLALFEVDATIHTHDSIARRAFVPQPGHERLVIVDEAHAFRNPATQRYAALARMILSGRILLMTATPLCNSPRDLLALLRLLFRDDAFSDAGVPSIDMAFELGNLDSISRILDGVMIRREAVVLPEALRFGQLRSRFIHYPVPDPGLESLRFPLTAGAAILRRFLVRRLESSGAALSESLKRQRRFYERVLESGRAMTRKDYRRAFADDDHEDMQQILFWEMWSPPGEIDLNEIRMELEQLDRLIAESLRLAPVKREKLEQVLRELDAPAIIFTGATATARELGRQLGCGVVTSRDGRAAIDAFVRGRTPVLVATDLAGEGLNLQIAGAVIHYDLPWNPVRLEQRIGRAHRIGQQREQVISVYFVPDNDRSRVVATIARKNRMRRTMVTSSGPAKSGPCRGAPMRPRVERDDPAFRFIRRAEQLGLRPGEALERRHQAGIEIILREMAVEYLDGRRLEDLLALAAAER